MIKQSADEQTAFVYYGLCDKSEFVGIMHNAKCIMHNYMFLFVGAAIGSPYGNTFCNGRPMGAPTFSHQAFKDLDKLLFVQKNSLST